MLIEVTILVPLGGSMPGRSLAIESRAAALFGGFTWRQSVSGGWVDPEGLTHHDASGSLVLAVDTLGDLALAVAFAREIGLMLGEQSMYVSALGVSECVEVGQ